MGAPAQCRWNYRDEPDVTAVNAGFDENDIPYDVLWVRRFFLSAHLCVRTCLYLPLCATFRALFCLCQHLRLHVGPVCSCSRYGIRLCECGVN